ncbi:hypothetical protein LINPERHAP1_LOCUS3994 [Linum perenne]
MRFNCVCKGWKSIIGKDLHFINLHYTNSEARPGLFIVAPTSKPISSSSSNNKKNIELLSLLPADLHCDGRGVVSAAANLQSIKKIVLSCSIPEDVYFLGPIRGLLCLVDHFAV